MFEESYPLLYKKATIRMKINESLRIGSFQGE
jgi:hypothetical protein